MKKLNRKGFTIVELVIVIAVIGVLAAVLIPTFTKMIRKSQVSNDTQLIRNLNTALEADKVESKHVTMTQALQSAKDYGYDISKINASRTNNEIVWDAENDVFCYVNEGKLEYLPDSVDNNKKLQADSYKLWKIYADAPKAGENFSIYVAGQGAANYVNTNDVNVGVDCGDYTVQNVSYKNDGAKRDVVIRTNGGTLTVNAPADTVKHYGDAQVVTLTAVGTTSYYENGKIDQVNIKNGRLVLTNAEESSVETIYLQATDDTYDNIIIATQSGAELPNLIARDNVSLPTGTDAKTVVTIQSNVNEVGENPEKVETINLYAEKDVKEKDNGYNVSDLGVLVVEAISSDAKTQAAEQITNPEVVAKVSETKSTFEVTSQDDMDAAIEIQAKHITILNDFPADKLFLLNFNTIIDGKNNTLTSSANRVFRVAGNDRSITIRNLKMISAYSGSDSRVISIDSNYDTINLKLDNCSLKCDYYALNITGVNGSGSRNITIDVNNSIIEGYAAINNHASSSKITVNNSTLIGNNKFAAGSSNSFSTIVFDGGNYEYEGSYTYGNIITVNNSTLKQITLTTNYQTVFNSQYGNISSEAHFNNCTIEHEGDNARYFNYQYPASNNVKIYIDNELVYEGK